MSQTIILNSANATYLSAAKSTANFVLGHPLRYEDKTPEICISKFSFTNFFNNITTGVNDTIYYSDDSGDETKYEIVIPQGSYSVDSLNSYIQFKLIEDGNAPGLFNIYGDASTNKVYYVFSDTLTGWYIHFDTDSPYTILGGTNGQEIPAGKSNVVNYTEFATNQAAFNSIEALNIGTNLSSNVIYGVDRSNILYHTVPTAAIGYVQQDEPYNLSWSISNSLSTGVSEIQITITDQDGNLITFSENWIIEIRIRY